MITTVFCIYTPPILSQLYVSWLIPDINLIQSHKLAFPFQMKFILVAAMAKNRVIGKDNWFPWDLPHEMEDMRGFIRGKTLVM